MKSYREILERAMALQGETLSDIVYSTLPDMEADFTPYETYRVWSSKLVYFPSYPGAYGYVACMSRNPPVTEPQIQAWNTGRRYTEFGQRIAAVRLDNDRVAFLDLDRSIAGLTIPVGDGKDKDLQSFTMQCYDYKLYESWLYRSQMDIDRRTNYAKFIALEKALRDAANAVTPLGE